MADGSNGRRSISAEQFSSDAAAYVAREYPQADMASVLLGPLIQRAARVQLQQSESLIHRQYGLGYSGFTALFLLQIFGPLEAQALARVMGISRQAVSTVVATLEKQGLISRTQGEDRRTFVLRLTDEGEQVGGASLAQQTHLSERWFECLTPDERDSLLEMLQRVIAHARSAGEATRREAAER